MRVIECAQGTPDWYAARLGVPTASRFSEIITPTGKLSESSRVYLCELLAERLIGQPMDAGDSGFMQRGTLMEREAVAYYELQRGLDARPVGFCLHDNGLVGCSPDRLVGDDGLLEIKCPSAPNHIFYMLEGMPKKYAPQVQGQLWVTDRKWVDLVSYNPELPPVLVRIERDDEYISKLSEAVGEFVMRLNDAEARLSAIKAA